MRKSFIFALAAAGLLSSCSSDDAISTGAVEDSNLVPIQLGVSSNAITTRGTGTVGYDETTSTFLSTWAGQKVNVFMLDANMGRAYFAPTKENPNSLIAGYIYEDAELITPQSGAATNIATRSDNKVKYYPPAGNYSFWGYRLDDAKVGTPDSLNKEWSVRFEIDGSQDVMTGKTTTVEGFDSPERLYSAFSARQGVNPTLEFQHLLARLQFEVKDNGMKEDETESNIKIVAIRVKSKTTGKLTFAYEGEKEYEDIISFDKDQEMKYLSLKRRAEGDADADALVNLTTEGDNTTYISLTKDYASIGEALLVSPEDQYEMEIVLAQTVEVDEETGETQEQFFPVTGIIPPVTAGETFKDGYSYKVRIMLYGLSKIDIHTTLVPWNDGGEIDITPENQI